MKPDDKTTTGNNARGAAVRAWLDGDRSAPLRLPLEDAPCLCEGRWWRTRLGRETCWRSALAWVARRLPTSSLRVACYRLAGARIERGVYLSPDVLLDPLYPQLVRLEEDALLGMGARVLTHEYTATGFMLGRTVVEPGAVLGGWSTVRAGVRVGAGATVGAHSFAVRDVPPHETVSGVPAAPLATSPAPDEEP